MTDGSKKDYGTWIRWSVGMVIVAIGLWFNARETGRWMGAMEERQVNFKTLMDERCAVFQAKIDKINNEGTKISRQNEIKTDTAILLFSSFKEDMNNRFKEVIVRLERIENKQN